jgi:hypothetical protein
VSAATAECAEVRISTPVTLWWRLGLSRQSCCGGIALWGNGRTSAWRWLCDFGYISSGQSLVRHHRRSRLAQTEIGPERTTVVPRSVVAMRSQSFQTPGNSGGEAGTAALTSARAACKAASLVWSREVFSTVPPSPLSLSRTLSAVTLRTSTKSAAVPG